MTIIASCGHPLAEDEGVDGVGFPVSVKAWSRENTPAVHYMVLCEKCYIWYKEEGYLLYTREEELEYCLHGD